MAARCDWEGSLPGCGAPAVAESDGALRCATHVGKRRCVHVQRTMGGPFEVRCSNIGKHDVDGRAYCGVHHPDRVRARDEALAPVRAAGAAARAAREAVRVAEAAVVEAAMDAWILGASRLEAVNSACTDLDRCRHERDRAERRLQEARRCRI